MSGSCINIDEHKNPVTSENFGIAICKLAFKNRDMIQVLTKRGDAIRS